jgi:hypothetical protein
MRMIIILWIFLGGAVKTKFTDSIKFLPDTTVNNSFILQNHNSIERNFGDLMPLIKNENNSLDVYFLNIGMTEYLKLTFYPGCSSNSFSYFEVGKPDEINEKFIKSNFKLFQTENRIKLGINKKELLKTKGKKYISIRKGGEEVMIYTITEMGKSPFLTRYNMPVYKAVYTLKNDKLIKFSFGFEYP